MCIYCATTKYRKIYEQHYGEIPVDSSGRKYDIHHIDGNHFNNDPTNLKAVSLQEHYDIHYSQQDYGACWLISRKMKLKVDELSKLASLSNNRRIRNGTHNLQKRPDGTSVSSDRVKNGTHPLLGKGLSHPKVDKTVYHFENKLTREKVSMTQYEFVRKYSLCQANINRVIKGTQNSYKKWIVVK